jgi:hypothetical protein
VSTDLARTDPQSLAPMTADPNDLAVAMESILATGDLSKLTPAGRVSYYLDLCQSLSLNPRSRPFDWLILDGKLVLYPNKSSAEQLRRQHQISVKVTRREIVGDLFVCEVEGRTPSGRTDEASKYVPLTGPRGRLVGRDLANAFAKAETGAKRRLVLSMVGLASPPDPEEVASARYVVVDGTGRVLDHPTEEQRYLAENPNAARAIGEPTFETVGGADAAPLAGTPDQRVTMGELTPPRREGPRPTFKASDEEIEGFRRAWFAAVKGLSLDSDDARHRFVAAWTADEWPKAKRTESLTTMRARMTTSEADDFLAHVRALMEDERQELLAQSHENMPDPEPEPRRRSSQRVHDAVVLTGGTPLDGADDEGETPAEAF